MIETALLANWISLTLLWLISLRMKDSSIIDIYWGFGFVLICWVCLLSNQNDGLALSITQGLCFLWSPFGDSDSHFI